MASWSSSISYSQSHGSATVGPCAPSHFYPLSPLLQEEETGWSGSASLARLRLTGLLQVKKDTELPWCRNKAGRTSLAQSLCACLTKILKWEPKRRSKLPILWRSLNTGEQPQNPQASRDRMMDGFRLWSMLSVWGSLSKSAGRQILTEPRVHSPQLSILGPREEWK